MSNIIHIHQVIFLIEKLGDQKVKADQLPSVIKGQFGEDVQHSACSGIPFDPEEALEFLLDRNKIIVDEEGFIHLHPTMKLCNSHA
ncbi:DUF2492 family protein [Algivirga pacifica]|uniref:Metal-binding protein n=1 Tax=Algivirga pacifica TaxID=1162670 RepID=A0ABP9DFX9_9BACT